MNKYKSEATRDYCDLLQANATEGYLKEAEPFAIHWAIEDN